MSSAMSSTPVQVLYTGIFSDERVLQLLHILQTLSEHCFSKLHEVSNEGRPSSTEYAHRFKRGLDSIEYWKSDIKNEETKFAIQQYPELGALYKYAIVCYLKELYRNERTDRIPVSIPPLQDFLHSYYVALSKTSYMQKLEFLNVYGLERTHMHMEALRSILMDFTRHSVYRPSVELSSSYAPAPTALPATAIRGLVSVEKEVTPWDSVSQRGDKHYEDEVQPGIVTHAGTTARRGTNSNNKSIYDKATENYYNKPAAVTPLTTEALTQRNAHYNRHNVPLEVEKEERKDDEGSQYSSSSADSRDLKFRAKPHFPKLNSKPLVPTATKHEPVVAPPKIQIVKDDEEEENNEEKEYDEDGDEDGEEEEQHTIASSQTIHLNVPERSVPSPPSPSPQVVHRRSHHRSNHRQPRFFE